MLKKINLGKWGKLKIMEDSKKIYKTTLRSGAISCIILALVMLVGFWVYNFSLKNAVAERVSQEEIETFFEKPLAERAMLKKLPYNLVLNDDLPVNAGACVVLDTSNNCLIYQKNQNAIIPPASMLKLVVMYIVFQEVAAGNVSLSDVVPLPPECWHINIPADSSKMFLAEGQTVTLDELLQGLAVCSGNDAAIAVAHYISGSVDAFVERMNYEMSLLGLEETHFVEPSGYSEKNITTPFEFAIFANHYINKYPESLENYHSLLTFEYPKEENLPKYQQGQGRTPILQYNTNKTLGKIEGVNGLKTGFIYESGYNLSLTAKRGETQFLSITMQGPGQGSEQGNKYRMEDASTILEWAFASFSSVKLDSVESQSVVVSGGVENAVSLVADIPSTLTVPHIQENLDLTVTIQKPEVLRAPVKEGVEYGKVIYSLGDKILQEIPLVASKSVDYAPLWKRALDKGILGK